MKQNFVSTCHHDVLQSTHEVKLEPLQVRQGDFETSAPSPSPQAAAPPSLSHHEMVTDSHQLLQLEESPPRALSPQDSHECEESDAPRRWLPLDPWLRQ
jgi:hypothetical protein